MPAVQRDLDDHVRRTAEADQQQTTLLRHRRPLERAVTDQSTAQQWRDVFVIEAFGQLVCEVLRNDGIFRISAIGVITRIARVAAKVLASSPAELAGAVHMPQPCDADPLPDPQARHTVADFIHSPDNLMTGNERHLVKGEIALDDVNIGAADRADAHFHPDLTRPDPRRVHFPLSQRRLIHALLLCQNHRAHSFRGQHQNETEIYLR